MEGTLFGTETEYAAAGTLSPTELAYKVRGGVFEGRRYGLIEPAPREWGEIPGNGGFLFNGGRMYLDSGHLEYATPECRSLDEIVAAEQAGDLIVVATLGALGLQGENFFIKNNTDHFGNTYGYHENYCIRSSPRSRSMVEGLLPFLVTRQLYAGAGMVRPASVRRRGSRQGALPGPVASKPVPPFEISQRAAFITVDVSNRVRFGGRPILNVRDEPLAGGRLRRLHNIIGDANRSEYATRLKIGTTALVTQLLDDGWQPDIELENPVHSLRDIAANPFGGWTVKLSDGSTIPAVDVQRRYLVEANLRYFGRDDDTTWVLRQWSTVLNGLETDPMRLDGYLDWVTKFLILERRASRSPQGWEDPALIKLDLAYHHVDPAVSLVTLLQKQGKLKPLAPDGLAERLTENPPSGSRAMARGRVVRAMAESRIDDLVDWRRIGRRLGERGTYGDGETTVFEYVESHRELTDARAWPLINYLNGWSDLALWNPSDPDSPHVLPLGDPFTEGTVAADEFIAAIPGWVQDIRGMSRRRRDEAATS